MINVHKETVRQNCLCAQQIKHTAMKAYGSRCIDPHYLDLGTRWSEWSASRPCRFTPEERTPAIHWLGCWVDLRAGLDDSEKRKFLT
jgi:hypothetical protein